MRPEPTPGICQQIKPCLRPRDTKVDVFSLPGLSRRLCFSPEPGTVCVRWAPGMGAGDETENTVGTSLGLWAPLWGRGHLSGADSCPCPAGVAAPAQQPCRDSRTQPGALPNLGRGSTPGGSPPRQTLHRLGQPRIKVKEGVLFCLKAKPNKCKISSGRSSKTFWKFIVKLLPWPS